MPVVFLAISCVNLLWNSLLLWSQIGALKTGRGAEFSAIFDGALAEEYVPLYDSQDRGANDL
jgi:hypothetical protein